jgi:hypothetical protein
MHNISVLKSDLSVKDIGLSSPVLNGLEKVFTFALGIVLDLLQGGGDF